MTEAPQITPAEILQIAARAVQLYAEQHPRPPHITQSQAAEALKVSKSTVSRMVRCGQIHLNACGLIPISEIDRVIETR